MKKSWDLRVRIMEAALVCVFLFLTVILLLFYCFYTAHAWGFGTLADFFAGVKGLMFSIKDKFDTIVSIIKDPSNLLDVIFDGADHMLSAVFNNSVMIDALDDLFTDASGLYRAVANYGTAFYGVLKKIALGIAGYGCAMAAIDEIINNPRAADLFFFICLRFPLMGIAIEHCSELTRGLTGMGMQIVHASRNYTDTRTQFRVSVLGQLKEAMGMGPDQTIKALAIGILGLLAVLLLSATIVQFIKVRLYMICIGILFDLAVRSLFMPLGIAWIPFDGIRGRSFHYIKGYAGVFMRIAVCYLSAFCISAFTAAASNINSGFDLIVIISLWYTMPAMAQSSDAVVQKIIGN